MLSTEDVEIMRSFGEGLNVLDDMLASPEWAEFTIAFRATTPPSTLRRWRRDVARAIRRPSLIHNGRKPR